MQVITLYVARIDVFDNNQSSELAALRGIKMNKYAQVPNLDSIDKAVKRAADENDLSNAERMFLKKKLESEIRVKLAEFANEISQARKLRDK
ncbi:MAG: hypothetical protein KJN90_15280 [Gammaproteobacteria bacterium]|nr:hypothetical protein [Gammaproteobacteria bacterium]